MTGDNGRRRVEPGGAVALEQRPHGHAEQDPCIDREQQGRQQTEAGGVGSGGRLLHKLGILTLFVGMSAVLVTWVVALVWGAVWVLHHLPLV